MNQRPTHIPAILHELIEQLRRAGYVPIEETPYESGNWIYSLSSGSVRVRIILERAMWFTEVSGADWGDEWFDPVTWRAYLDGEPDAGDVVSLERQATDLLDDEPRIRAVLQTESSRVLPALQAVRRDGVYRSVGLLDRE